MSPVTVSGLGSSLNIESIIEETDGGRKTAEDPAGTLAKVR